MADPGHAHHLKEQVEEAKKEAQHEHNVKEKHHEIKHPTADNPFPHLQHEVETGKIEVMSADGKVTGQEADPITQRPPQG